ncbi:MAG: T9SS type B sorting domain-containing protein [Putridiphycobacter sp.]
MKKIFLLALNLVLIFGASAQSDGCSAATTISVTANCSTPTFGTTTGATQTIAGCAGTADDDVWYQFVATATSHQIVVTPGDAGFDPVVQLFSGACSVLTSLSCTDNGLGGDTETINYSGLTIGQTYRIRVYHYYSGSGTGNFSICVTNTPPPPANDACANATPLTVNTTCVPTSATTDGASQSLIGCAGNADDDVWFSFTATNSVQNILVSPIDNIDLVFQVYSGSCGSLTSLLCEDSGFTGDNEQSDVVGLTPGVTYFVRVYDYYTGVTGDFNICVTGPATAAPINDDPCNAIALPTVTSECHYGYFTTTGSTASTGAPTPSSCVGGSGAAIGGFSASSHDVWFSVTVPSSGSIDIIPEPNGGAGSITDGVMVLYTGTCGSLTQVACSDDHNYPGSANDFLPFISASGLTPGSTVFIRYFGFGTSFGDFGLCVTTTTNDDCANALYICDPNGYSGSTSPAYTADRPSNMHGNNETSTGIDLADGTDSGGPFGDGNPWDATSPYSGSPALDVLINNNSWIKFTASNTTAVLNVSIYDCWVGSYPSGGIQMQIFEATNCTNFVPVSNFAENSTGFTITATNLTIGNDYYLMIDGYAGDICNYTISANSGVQFPDITPSEAVICQNSSITLTAPPGATSYLWPHSGETTPSVVVTPATTQTYVCEVTGLCNYKQTLSSTVTVNQTPSVSTASASSSSICSGSDAVFNISGTANAQVTYNINGGASQTTTLDAGGNATITISAPSVNQTLNITNIELTATGCSAPVTSATTVTVNPNPTYSVTGTDPTACGGTDGSLTISGLNASTNYNVSYDDGGITVGPNALSSNGSGIITITGLDQGTYDNFVVEVAATSCSTNDNTTTINLTDPSSPTITSVNGTDPSTCSGTDGSVVLAGLNASTTYDVSYDDDGTPVGPISLTSNASGQITISGLNAGTYDNFVVTLAGCSGSNATAATLNDPASPILNPGGLTNNSPICSGDNATFNISGSANAVVTYTINGGATQTVTTDGSGNATVTITGATADQTIDLSDIAFVSTSCNTALTNTSTITVNSNPTFSSLTSNSPICSGSDAIFTLSGTPNADISYTINGGATQTVTTDGSGNATVTITGATADQTIALSDIAITASGCNTSISNSTTVTVNPNPTYSVTGTDPTACGGTDGSLTISGLNASTNYNVSYDDGGVTVGPTALSSNGSGVITITGLDQGTYDNFVVEVAATSCSTNDNTTTINLTDPSSPTITSVNGTDPSTCSGTDGSVVLAGLNASTTYDVSYDDDGTPVGPISLTSNASGQITISGLNAGTYDNFVVTLAGCSGSNATAATLNDPASPILNPGGLTNNSPICSGDNATFNISGSANAVVTYTINGGATQTVTTDGSGNATVTITGATADQTIDLSDIAFVSTSCNTALTNTSTITVNSNPTFSSLTSNSPICSGSDAIFTLSGTPNADISYTINGGATQTVTTDGSGNATVTITGATADQTIALSDIAIAASGCNTSISNSTTVTVNPNPTYSVTGTDPTACGGTDGSLTISGLNASTNYNVSYDDGGATVGPTAVSSNGSGVITITGLDQGTYDNFVVEVAATSCSTNDNTTSINLSDPGSPVISSITSTDPTTCGGVDGTITISGLNPSSTYNVSYDDDGTPVGPLALTTDGSGAILISNLDAGTYNNFSVEITGCTASDNTTLNLSDPASPTITGVVGSDPTTCGGNDGSITISGLSPSTSYNISYDDNGTPQGPISMTSDASGNIIINNLIQGNYSNFGVEVPSTGCSDLDNSSIALSDPNTPNISSIGSSDPTTCGGTDGTLTISGLTANTTYDVSYDDDGTLTGPLALTTDVNGDIIISSLDAGTYSNFTVSLSGCVTNDNSSLTLSDPTVPNVDAGPDNLNLCEGTNVTLTASNPDGANISWDNGVTDGVSFNQNVGSISYVVTATDANNCTNTDTIEIIMNSEPTLNLASIVIIDETCTNGGSVTGITVDNGTPNFNYNWTDGTNTVSSTAEANNLTTGNYTLIVTDANGCDDTTDVTINFTDNSVVIAVNDSTLTKATTEVTFNVYPNDTGDETSITIVSLPNNGTVVNNGNGEMSYTPDEGFVGIDTLTYLICDPNCTNSCDTATVYITIEKIDSLIIPNGFTPNGDNFNDYFVIENLEQYPNNNIIIFNRWGDVVFTASPYNNDWDGTSTNVNIIVNGNQVVDGTYFFVLDIGEEGEEKINGFIDLRRK